MKHPIIWKFRKLQQSEAANGDSKTSVTFTVSSGAILATIVPDDAPSTCSVANLVDVINGVTVAHITVTGHNLVEDLITATKASTGVDVIVDEGPVQFTGGLTSNMGQMTFLGCHMVDAANSAFLFCTRFTRSFCGWRLAERSE